MLPLRQWSISRRILLIGTFPAFIAVLLATTYQMFQRWSELREDSDLSTETAMALMAEAAYYPVISGNFHLIDPWASQTLKHLTIVSITIIDENGEVRYDKKVSRYNEINPADLHSLSVPISWDIPVSDDSTLIGDAIDPGFYKPPTHKREVRFEVSDMFLNEREQDILMQSLVVGFSVVFLSMLAAGAISTTIIPPLIAVSEFIGSLVGGSRRRIKIDNGAEIGALQIGANRLARSLEHAENEQKKSMETIKIEQKKSLAASQAKNDFLAMMSHELITPLNGINGSLELLDRSNSKAEFKEYRDIASHSVKNLTQMIEDVLVIVDMEKSVLKSSAKEHNLIKTLEVLINEYSQQAMSKSLSFVVEYDDFFKDRDLCFDPSHIRQIVRHLVDNAIKFTSEGYVSVRLSCLQQLGKYWLGIQVLDTGIGIPKDKRSTVLEAFSQAEFSFSRTHDGLGLGLTITNYISQYLNGSVVIRDNDGRGTDIMVTLPILLAGESGDGVISSEPLLNILIVEDNHVNLRVAEGLVRCVYPNANITSVMNGEKCLALDSLPLMDIVLMDCQMAGLDGFETTRKIREMGYSMPVIACTANSPEVVEARSLEVGMNGFLGKPLSLVSVRDELRKWGT